MRAEEFLQEAEQGVTLYHVTKTATVPRILAKGITGANPTNFKQAGNKEQYGNIGEIFCMNNKTDAIRWAAAWEWQLASSMGKGIVSIVTFVDHPKTWKIDDSDPLSQSSNEGEWLKKTAGFVPAAHIVSAEPVTSELIRTITYR